MADEPNREKLKRIQDKMEDLMVEVADEMLDDEMREKMDEKIKDVFSGKGIPNTLSHFKAFYEGICMGMAAGKDEESQLGFILIAVLKSSIVKREKELSDKADTAMGSNASA